MSFVLGLDLSLTSTGVALIFDDGVISTECIKSTGKKGQPIHTTARRLRRITEEVLNWATDAEEFMPTLAVIEAPSYGSNNGSQHERGGLWWMVADELTSRGVPIATVSPQGRAKYATGSGRSGKDEVLAAAIKRYMEANIAGNDQADAVVLAAMGARYLDFAVEIQPLSRDCLMAMDGANWPVPEAA